MLALDIPGLRWGHCTSVFYTALYSKYTNAQPLVEDVRVWRRTPDTWTHLHGRACESTSTSLKVCSLKVRLQGTYCTLSVIRQIWIHGDHSSGSHIVNSRSLGPTFPIGDKALPNVEPSQASGKARALVTSALPLPDLRPPSLQWRRLFWQTISMPPPSASRPIWGLWNILIKPLAVIGNWLVRVHYFFIIFWDICLLIELKSLSKGINAL